MYVPDAEATFTAAPSTHPARGDRDPASLAAPRPDLRVVAARRTPRRAIPRAWVVTVVGLVVAVLTLYVHTVIQEARLNRLKHDIDDLRELTVRDRMEYEQARNPQNIDRKAAGIGMKAPNEVVYLDKPVPVKRTITNVIPLPQAVTHEGF